MPILLFVLAIALLLIVAMFLFRSNPGGGSRSVVVVALLGALVFGLLSAGAVWLMMDAQRSIARTNLVRAVEQMDDLARANDHAALGAAIAACRMELDRGSDTINALGQLNTKLFQRRREINLVDVNGRKVP